MIEKSHIEIEIEIAYKFDQTPEEIKTQEDNTSIGVETHDKMKNK